MLLASPQKLLVTRPKFTRSKLLVTRPKLAVTPPKLAGLSQITGHMPRSPNSQSQSGACRLSPTQTSETVKLIGFSYCCARQHALRSDRPDSVPASTSGRSDLVACRIVRLRRNLMSWTVSLKTFSLALGCLGAKNIATKSSQTAESTTLTLCGPCLCQTSPGRQLHQPSLAIGTTATLSTTRYRQQQERRHKQAANAMAQSSAQDELAVDLFRKTSEKLRARGSAARCEPISKDCRYPRGGGA